MCLENLICAQIFSIIGYLLFAISFWQKEYKNVLYIQIVALISMMIQFILLKAYSGMVVDLVNIVRTIVFSKRKSDSINHLLVFGGLIILGVFLTWTDIYSIFSMMAGITYLIASYSKNLQKVRVGAIFSSLFWIVYGIHNLAYVSCVCEMGTIGSNVIAFVKNRNEVEENKG